MSREPEAPKGMPSTRGVLFRSTYRVLGAYQGAAWAAHVGRRYPALGQPRSRKAEACTIDDQAACQTLGPIHHAAAR
jgi:hypothetical protein